MILGPDGNLIGHCGLTEQEGRVVLSYALRKEYWCMELAPEACRTVLDHGFKALGVEEIWTTPRSENRAWQSVMEKLGMHLRETERIRQRQEMVHYAATREKFFSRAA